MRFYPGPSSWGKEKIRGESLVLFRYPTVGMPKERESPSTRPDLVMLFGDQKVG